MKLNLLQLDLYFLALDEGFCLAALYRVSEIMTRDELPEIGVGLIQSGERGRFAMPIPLRADYDAQIDTGRGQAVQGWPTGAAAFGSGGHLRGRDPDGSGGDRRRDRADHSRLGDEIQCVWPGWPDRPQGPGPAAPAERCASGGAGGNH